MIVHIIIIISLINDYLHQMAYTEYMHMFYGKMPNTKLGDVIIEHSKSSIQVGEAKKQFGNIPFLLVERQFIARLYPLYQIEAFS